eukprot:726512-Amorphochlora_amoeboformis.AAC.1
MSRSGGPSASSSSAKSTGKKASKGGNEFGGPSLSRDFEDWCRSHLKKLSGSAGTKISPLLSAP